jgi:predicted alpha/beta hydrolase
MTPPPSSPRRVAQRDETFFLRAGDGVPLTLIRVHGTTEPTKGPVLLVHGVAMRGESFRPPVARTLVDTLLDDGWDVWIENWRGSTDLDPLPWTLDDVALHDHPVAVRHILAVTGAEKVKIVAHCQGAASISMSAVSGLLPHVDTIVANGVTLHPVVPRGGKVKLHVLRPLAQVGQPYVDIAWGDGPERGIGRVTRNAVRLWHAECREPACNMASFALGSGHPALWRHAHLNEATHAWISGEFGRIPLSFYAQLAASDRARQMVAVRRYAELPRRYADTPPRTDARFVLLTGSRNRAFLPESQKATFAFLDSHRAGRHSLHVIPGYGHADVFLGARAHVDVFPRIISELNRSA